MNQLKEAMAKSAAQTSTAAGALPSLPWVSVVILNYKRRDALVRVLESIRKQDYARRETIVVDNASKDGIREFVREHAPEVRLIELPANRGACAGRNAGIRAAHGEIIVTLDNDMYFDSPDALRTLVRIFDRRPEVHVLAFQVCDPETGALRLREWCHPRNWKEFGGTEFETDFFVEGAAAYRREVFDAAGLYYDPLFIGVEEHDLALRFLDHGFRILYSPQIRVRHLMSPVTRTPERFFYYYTRNYIWIAWKNYPLLDGLRFLVPKLLMVFYFTLRAGRVAWFGRGILAAVRGLPQVHRDRAPIRKATVRYVDELEKFRPGLLLRLERHIEQPQV